MRVVFLASTYPRFAGDGSGRFVQSIAEAVQGLGHEVHVMAPYHPLVKPFESAVHLHHFHYIWRSDWHIMGYAQAMQSDQNIKIGALLLAPFYYLSAYFNLRQLLLRQPFDVIHVHWVIPNGPIALPLAKRFKLPLVVTLHGSDIFFALHNSLYANLSQKVFQYANAVTACSPDLEAGALKLGASASKTFLLPWGADPDVFVPKESKDEIRQRWGLPAEVPILVSLGRLVRKKGIEYLIRALPTILIAFPKALLLIAGNGPELPVLQGLSKKLEVQGSIRFLGEIAWQDVPEIFSLSDIFVVPSIHDEKGNLDGLPTTIPEAMAAARPIVATSVAGIPLAVQHEYNGLLVPEAQPDALAKAILRLLENPVLASKYGFAGRNRVVNELNWRQVAQRFEQFYSAPNET